LKKRRANIKKSLFSFYTSPQKEEEPENFFLPYNPLYSYLIYLMIYKSWKNYAMMMHENPQEFLKLENDSESSFLEIDEKSSSSIDTNKNEEENIDYH